MPNVSHQGRGGGPGGGGPGGGGPGGGGPGGSGPGGIVFCVIHGIVTYPLASQCQASFLGLTKMAAAA